MANTSRTVLDFLRGHRDDRGAMATLRCALIDAKRHRAWPILARFDGIGSDFRALTVQLIAGLYASHPDECNNGDLGSTCRAFASEAERSMIDSKGELGPVSRRMQHLLAAEGEEVFPRVLRLVLRAKAEGVPVNYGQLLEDLMQWRYDPDAVRVRWARGFWVATGAV
jgi:CRISPR system Cascade subunit CasB